MRQIIVIAFSLLCSYFSAAQSIANRPRQINGDLLVRGLWTVAFDYSNSGRIDSQYNSYGNDVSFTRHLKRNLTVGDMLENVDGDSERALAKAAFTSHGLNENDVGGVVQNSLELQYSSQTFVLGYGASSDFTLLFVAPSIKLDVKVDSRIQYASGIKKMVAELKEQGLITTAEEIETRSRDVLAQQFERYNYDPDYVSSWEGIPNFYVIGRYASRQMKSNGLSLDTTFVIPNERDAYSNQFTPVRLFEESPSVIEALNYKRALSDRTNLNVFGSYQIRTRHSREVRVPEENDSPFSDDRESVDVKIGDEWATGVQFSHLLSNWATPFVNLTYRAKFRDSYRGDQFASARYSYLEEDTSQNLTSWTAGAALSSIEAFLAHKFPIPVLVTAAYSDSFSGKNTFSNGVYSLNLMIFYKDM